MTGRLSRRNAQWAAFAALFVWVSLTATAAPEPAGWYAGDMHVHRSCGGSPEGINSLRNKMTTNNLRVISLLADMGNAEVQDAQQDLPKVGSETDLNNPPRMIHWDTEWHWDATYGQYAHQGV